jgi:hypothetical protein
MATHQCKERFLVAHRQATAAHSTARWRHTGTSPELSIGRYEASFFMVLLPTRAAQGGELTGGSWVAGVTRARRAMVRLFPKTSALTAGSSKGRYRSEPTQLGATRCPHARRLVGLARKCLRWHDNGWGAELGFGSSNEQNLGRWQLFL